MRFFSLLMARFIHRVKLFLYSVTCLSGVWDIRVIKDPSYKILYIVPSMNTCLIVFLRDSSNITSKKKINFLCGPQMNVDIGRLLFTLIADNKGNSESRVIIVADL